MGLRIWRRFKIAPGLTLNLSKGGVSTSVGHRGARVTFGKHGVRQTVGIPGTGVYYTHKSGTVPRGSKVAEVEEVESDEPLRLVPPWWRRIFMGADELAFLEGVELMADGCEPDALDILGEVDHPDSKILAGFLVLGEFPELALDLLATGRADRRRGQWWAKHGLPDIEDLEIDLARHALMMQLNRWPEAERLMLDLLREHDGEPDVHFRAAVHYLECPAPVTVAAFHHLARGGDRPEVELLRAMALNNMGQHEAAASVCTAAGAGRKANGKIAVEIHRALRLERARAWRGVKTKAGTRKARVECQKLLAEDPDDEAASMELADMERGS